MFLTRPKTGGLWVRLIFRDGDQLEATLSNNLLQVEPRGVTVTLPDLNGNCQRAFVPREALRELQVLGVVGSPLRREAKQKPRPADREQIKLFE